MLTTDTLSFSYNQHKTFKFEPIKVNPHESLLITGKSGVGKSTLLSLIGGLQMPSAGSVSIANQNINLLSNSKLDSFRGQNISFVFQEAWFIQSLTLLENFELVQQIAKKHNKTLITELAEKVSISSLLNKKPAQLSTGEKQRAALVRALITMPKLILADEPTSNLDDLNTEFVVDLLNDFIKNNQASLVVVSHDNRLNNKFLNTYTL